MHKSIRMITNKYRNLFFGALSLLIIAVTALITITLKQQPEVQTTQPVNVSGRGFAYVSNQLQFSPQQEEKYQKLVDQYQAVTRPLHQELTSLQHEVGDELNSANLDTMRINQLSLLMGDVYGRLKKETSNHLLAVKEICTPEQSTLLGQLYSSMIDETAHGNKQGRGQRKGQGQGRQRNRHGQAH